MILRIALYACETWSLTLSEERRLSVFDNRVLRICLSLRGNGKELYVVQLHGPYTSREIIAVVKQGRMRWLGHVARVGKRRGA
jgi:hypothetical protein